MKAIIAFGSVSVIALAVAFYVLSQPSELIIPIDTTTDSNANYPQSPARLQLTIGDEKATHCVTIGRDWTKLGPFQLGTREAEWGADPLELSGGFRNLRYDNTSIFRSSIADYGRTKWSSITRLRPKGSHIALNVTFDNVDWNILRSTYGWAGLQWQGWIRGNFTIIPECFPTDEKVTTVPITIHAKNILEIWVDGIQYFGGDVYGYSRAPLLLHLPKGNHEIDIRTFYDIRIFGGAEPPAVIVDLKISKSDPELILNSMIVPDIVDGKLASPWASLQLRNDGMEWLEVTEIDPDDKKNVCIVLNTKLRLAPGQSRPLKIRLAEAEHCQDVAFFIVYKYANEEKERRIAASLKLKTVPSPQTPHKYTYIHSSGIVSYGVLRAPSDIAACNNRKLPILLGLHGAGDDVDSPFIKQSFEGLPYICAWLVLPSGVTTWSGDDWHTWGLADAEAAIKAVPKWINSTEWKGSEVDINKWLVTGHSNGGQGVWYTMMHRNDHVLAGAPVSGYLSIPAYVPYTMWQEADVKIMSIVLSSLNPWRHELLVQNLAGLPIFQMHGSKDANVPVYHSRRMFQLLGELNFTNAHNVSNYTELTGKAHWFDGIMSYKDLGKFFVDFLDAPRDVPPLLEEFDIVVANPGDMGVKGGIKVDQLIIPDQLGKLHVEIEDEHWKITSSNVRRWHFVDTNNTLRKIPDSIDVNDQNFRLKKDIYPGFVFQKSEWNLYNDDTWKRRERYGNQLGNLNAFLNTRACFTLFYFEGHNDTTNSTYKVASDISRNLFQYFAADTDIISNKDRFRRTTGNVIYLNAFPGSISSSFPIQLNEDGDIVLQLSNGDKRVYDAEPGLGVIFIMPLSNERLGLVIWGSDEDGLRRAVQLMPLRTGVGQPDFIIIGHESAWKGIAGVRAMGFFDYQWRIASSSFLS